MLGASARYSCCNAPVETITAPRRSKIHTAPPAAVRQVSLIPLLLLSPPKPLTLGFGGVSFLQALYLSLPPGGESSTIPLFLLSKVGPLMLGPTLVLRAWKGCPRCLRRLGR